jgi:hypothetical protein
MPNSPSAAVVRGVYLQLAGARFDKAVADGELPERMLEALALALADESVVRVAKTGEALELTLPDGKTRRWNLAGLNHEYIVHLAVIGKLLELLGDERERLHVEYKTADAVVMRRGRTDAALLQVEVKTAKKGSEREQADASAEGLTPIRRRIAAIDPARVLFVWADIGAAVWMAVDAGRVVGDRATTVDWEELRDFLAHG